MHVILYIRELLQQQQKQGDINVSRTKMPVGHYPIMQFYYQPSTTVLVVLMYMNIFYDICYFCISIVVNVIIMIILLLLFELNERMFCTIRQVMMRYEMLLLLLLLCVCLIHQFQFLGFSCKQLIKRESVYFVPRQNFPYGWETDRDAFIL